ncbi:pilus assembly PilX family protein [Neisseriaceae bacterium B1]
MKYKNSQRGFSLFLVMVLMLVIAFLVIVTTQSSLTEMRSSSNEADRKVALSRAELGLQEAESRILELSEDKAHTTNFTDACDNGYCQPAKGSFDNDKIKAPFAYSGSSNSTVEAWYRCSENVNNNCKTNANSTVLDSANHSIATADNTGRYIIEYLGTPADSTDKEIFRITAKANGDNENTTVLLQSYVELMQ